MRSLFYYRPIGYFVAVFLATYLLWGIGSYLSFEPSLNAYYMIPMLLGLIAPCAIAVCFIWQSPQTQMRSDFKRRLFNPGLIDPLAYGAALLLMPASVIIAISLSLLTDGSVAQFAFADAFSFSTGFVPVLALLFLAASFEELGWRGYGFESLEQRFSFLHASLIFGVLWSLWHLPLLIVKGSYQYEIYHQNILYAANFYISTVVLGVIVSWVCHLNNRSILAAMFFHFEINLSQEMLSMTQDTKCIQTLVLTAFTVCLVFTQRKRFSKAPTQHRQQEA